MTLKMGAFEELDENEMLAVDGGVSEYAQNAASRNCGMGGAAVGLIVGYFIAGPIGSALGTVIGNAIGTKLSSNITSRW